MVASYETSALDRHVWQQFNLPKKSTKKPLRRLEHCDRYANEMQKSYCIALKSAKST